MTRVELILKLAEPRRSPVYVLGAIELIEADGQMLSDLAALSGRRGAAYDAEGDPYEVYTMSVPADLWHDLQRRARQ